MSQGQQIDEFIRKQALFEVRRSDIVEWYREQYNIRINSPEYYEINEEIALEDFYRRQYYAELRLGLRKLSDENTEFLMPSFPLLRQYGGIFPAPNGFKYSSDDTIDNKRLKKAAKKYSSSEDEEEEDLFKKNLSNENVPSHLKEKIEKPVDGMVRSENAEFGLEEEDFWKWVEAEEKKAEKETSDTNDGE